MDWGSLLTEYFEWRLGTTQPYTTAARTLPALLCAITGLQGPMRTGFPTARQTLGGWKRLQPLSSRPPIPWCMVVANAEQLLLARAYQSAVMVITMFETYFRPSELVTLTAQQVVLPRPSPLGSARFLQLVARAEELQLPTKTGEYDACVPLDLPRQQW